MNYELFIRSSSQEVDFALLKDGRLIELNKEEEANNFAVGDVFLAKIRKSMPGLNAAFGLVLELAGKFLEKGEMISHERFTFKVESVDQRKLIRLKVTINPET